MVLTVLLLAALLGLACSVMADNKERTIIDALDAKSWGGIVLAKGKDTAFGFRVATDIHGLLDGDSIYEPVREVGPHAPDGSYCRLKWSVAPAHGDYFSIRWEGKLSVPKDGNYKFYVTSDDGCRLYVDGKLLIDEWWDRIPTEFSTAIDLTSGQHDIKVDYYEAVGSASVKLEWESAAIKRQVIPGSAFSYDGKAGIKGSYYYGTGFQDFCFDRVDENINFDFAWGGPLPERNIEELVRLEWSQINENTVVGKVSIEGKIGGNALLISYFPWDYKGSYSIEGNNLVGTNGKDTFHLVTSPQPVAASLAKIPGDIKNDYTSDGKLGKREGDAAAGLQMAISPDKPVYFAASIEGKAPVCDPAAIDSRLQTAEAAYLKSRTEVTGRFEKTGESITNNINWMKLVIPHTDITYIPAGRIWIWSSWTVFEWDGFFNALLATIENKELAYSMIDALLYAQQPDGNIPNVANDPTGDTSVTRSQPQVGIYCVWKMYCKYGDKSFLEKIYPAMVKWHNWWLNDAGTGKPRRDGNDDGLLEWGADKKKGMQDAKFESGMDDAALFDEAKYDDNTWTMNMNSVDCSSLYALDALCLAKMAHELGNAKDEAHYELEHARLKKLINDNLWCEEAGMYLNRYWDGKFSYRMGCPNFYTLIAQVATPERAAKMMENLRDPKHFQGEWMIPTIARSDKAWKDQGYWRGTVWPPTNYLAYEGIKGYGFDNEAAMVAESGANLFLDNWKKTGTCRENYRSDTGEGGGQKYQSWGPLFSLIVMEEFVDVDPYNGGLQFGSFVTEDSTLKALQVGEHNYDVTIGSRLRVVRDGKILLESDAPVVIRGYKGEGGFLQFSVNAKQDCKLTLNEVGLSKVTIDGREVPSAAAGKLTFTVLAGMHSVVCTQ